MDNLVINHELPAAIVDDQGADTATTITESTIDLGEEAALVDDGQALLDIAAVGHADQTSVLTDVEDAVVLVHRTQHALNHNGVARVADEGALLMKLTGEEVHTQVPELTGLGRGRDADHLAGTALKDDKIANTNEVAWDGDGVGMVTSAWLNVANALTDTLAHTRGTSLVRLDDHFLPAVVVVMMVVMRTMDGMEDPVGGTLDSTAKAVVVALVVVIAHLVS